MTVLADSNLVIYASNPDARGDTSLAFIERRAPLVSAVSRVEALGYHELKPSERTRLEAFFQAAVVLSVSSEVIDRAVGLRQLRRMSLGDALIAGTALVHDLEFATHNTKDFDWIGGLTLIDPLA